MHAIDTSVLVRYLTRDDEALANRAANILKKAATASLLLDRLVIAELGYVLRSVYGFSKHQVWEVYNGLLSTEKFSIPDRELVTLAVKLFQHEKPLSFEDCWLLALRQAGKVKQVKSFDTDLTRRLN